MECTLQRKRMREHLLTEHLLYIMTSALSVGTFVEFVCNLMASYFGRDLMA